MRKKIFKRSVIVVKMNNKNTIVKILALTMALILTVGVLAGCGKTVNDKDDQGRTIIKTDQYPVEEGKDRDNYDARVARFLEANPDVVVEPQSYHFTLNSFYQLAEGGQLPTMFTTNFTEVEQCINAGYTADLSKVLKDRGYEGMFDQKVMDIFTRDGKIYAIPTAVYYLGLAYNVEMFEAAGLMNEDGTPKQPATWDEVVEFAKKIKEATGEAGFVLPTTNNLGGWISTPIFWSFGVDFMEQDENGKWNATFNSPEAIAALQWIKDLKWVHDILPSNTLVDDAEQTKLFAGNRGGMIISLGSNVGHFANFDMSADSIGFMALPAGPKRHVTLMGGHVMNVNGNATYDQIDAVFRWNEMKQTYKVTEEYKTNLKNQVDKQLEDGILVGIKNASVWSSQAEVSQYYDKYIEDNANININHVKLYNDFISNCPADIQAEEPVCVQELYAIIDGCIQEVLTNKDADCAAVIEKAASDFQMNYLNNL